MDKPSSLQRYRLIGKLSALPEAQFNQVVMALNPPPGVIASSGSPIGKRAVDLCQWLEGPTGTGLDSLVEILQEIPNFSLDEIFGDISSQKFESGKLKQSSDSSNRAVGRVNSDYAIQHNVINSVIKKIDNPIAGWHKQKILIIGIGVAAMGGFITVIYLSNPFFNWVAQSSSSDISPEVTEISPEFVEISGIASGNPESAIEALNKMAAKGEQNEAIQRILALGSIDDPTLLFAKGQLQWDLMNQSVVGNNTIGPAEAARSWQDALRFQPNWLDAQVALGFAYYEQENFEAAIDIWAEALSKGKDLEIPVLAFHDDDPGADIYNAPMKLHAQLGLAMAYYQESESGLTDGDKLPLLASAADYWQDFLETAEKSGVTTGDISLHWLWSEQALVDLNNARTKIEDYISQAN